MSPPALDDRSAAADVADVRRLRRKRYLSAVWSGAAARIVGILFSAASLALTVRYLGKERYGMWATISTMLSWLALANFGLGHGLTTRISAAMGRPDRRPAERAICSTYVIVTGVSAVLFVVAAVACAHVPWARVFNVTSATAIAEARPVASVALLLATAMLPLTIAASILTGHQRLDVSNLIAMGSGALGLAALFAATRLGASLPLLAIVVIAPVFLANLAQTLWAWRRGMIRIARDLFSFAEARSMLWMGGQFFILQVITLVVFEAGALIIAQRFNAAEVTPYAVTNRLMMLIVSFCNVILIPLWPAYGEAFGRGDAAWVRHVFWRTIRIVLAVWAPLALVLCFAGPTIIRLWAGPAAIPPTSLLVALVFYALSLVLGMVVAYPLNGIGELSSQMIGGGIMALLHVPLAIYLCGKMGPTGVAISQTALQLGIAIPFAYTHMFRVLRRAHPAPRLHDEQPVVPTPVA
ncbi:MAG TPA: MATE family efflux transporter [Tepidisphaeraceae bacterium]|jgi:O-antigen/teichoic acid export membrane protein